MKSNLDTALGVLGAIISGNELAEKKTSEVCNYNLLFRLIFFTSGALELSLYKLTSLYCEFITCQMQVTKF